MFGKLILSILFIALNDYSLIVIGPIFFFLYEFFASIYINY